MLTLIRINVLEAVDENGDTIHRHTFPGPIDGLALGIIKSWVTGMIPPVAVFYNGKELVPGR